MVFRPLRPLQLSDRRADRLFEDWLASLADRLTQPDTDRSQLCRDVLLEIYYPGVTDYQAMLEDPAVPLATKAALLALDPRNVTLEPEYYHEVDVERYQRVKPLLWLWQSFDRSPLGGGNVHLGVRFRRLLAPHIFRRCGQNFKCFQFVEFSFGYNLEVGDNVVVHRHVLLDDRGGITLADNVSIADYANVYSHSHSILDQRDVDDVPVVLEAGVRITYHATVLAGVRVAEDAMVGAMALATKDVPPHAVALGIPAKPVKLKER